VPFCFASTVDQECHNTDEHGRGDGEQIRPDVIHSALIAALRDTGMTGCWNVANGPGGMKQSSGSTKITPRLLVVFWKLRLENPHTTSAHKFQSFCTITSINNRSPHSLGRLLWVRHQFEAGRRPVRDR
jgi:hypothetical protein